MRSRRGILLACVVVVIVGVAVLSATRGDEPGIVTPTPPAVGQSTPSIGAAPAGCSVAPRPLTFLATLVDAPEPEVTPIPIESLPDGAPVDEATRGEVAATVATLVSCTNAGELLRAFALYEDGYLHRILDPEGVMTRGIANELAFSFATPEPVSVDRQTALADLPVVRVMSDGRVAVVTETNGGADDDDTEAELGLLILARAADGRWLIVDGRTGLERAELPAG